jgi:arylsulfatase
MEKLPNIILFMTDQQRYDSIRELGAEYMITPHLDRLVQEGVSFTNAFITAPSCVPSRASFFNGRFPLSMGVSRNSSKWENSWVELLQQAGYHTVNVGKMHTVPVQAPCGFDQRFIVENKDRPGGSNVPRGQFFDEWDKFLANSGIEKPSRYTYKTDYNDYENALGAFEWPLDEQYHSDSFVGNMAKWVLEKRRSDRPLFMQIGFPGPHPPYDPPQRWIDQYADVDIPIPKVTLEEMDKQPPAHAVARHVMMNDNFDAVKWKLQPTEAELLRLRRYYAANVSLIDEQIGIILETLETKGYLQDSIVIFMSDHGDSLGDHGHIQKWNMYDSVTRVPVIMWSPDRLAAGERFEGLIQHMDIAATLLDMAGIDAPAGWDAQTLWPQLEHGFVESTMMEPGNYGRNYVISEHGKDNVYKTIERVTMVRTSGHKLVRYDEETYGELYDLLNDPDELVNLWDAAAYESIRLALELLIHKHISEQREKANDFAATAQ